jgi:hypothetical protein
MSEVRSFLYASTELESKHLLLASADLVEPITIDGYTEKFGTSHIVIEGSSQVLPAISEGGVLYDIESKHSYKVVTVGTVNAKVDGRIVRYDICARLLQDFEVAP